MMSRADTAGNTGSAPAPDSRTAAAQPPLGYLVPEFPLQTHIFFWREVCEMRRAGRRVVLLSTRRPPEGYCRHEFAPAARSETHYLFPPRPSDLLCLLCNPGGFLRALGYVAGLKESSLRQKVRVLALSLCAVRLGRVARQLGVRHVHSHSCADAAHLVALAHILSGVTYSLTLHGCIENYGTDHRSKMRGAAFVSTAGQHLVEQVAASVGIPRDRLFSNPMGLDSHRFTPRDPRETTSPPAPIRIVTVARLDPGKGHRHAIAAISRLHEEGFNLTYTAAGRGALNDVLLEQARQAGLPAGVVNLPGTLSEAEVLELLRQADIFVLPSEGSFEAFPVSVMEAMCCGLPVVVSRIGATPDMIQDGATGFLCPKGDVDALTNCLRRLVSDGALRRRVGAAARLHAERNFDVRTTAARLMEAIDSSAGGQVVPASVPPHNGREVTATR